MLKIKNVLLSASLFINIMLLFLWAFESRIAGFPAWVKVIGRLHPMVLHFPIALLLLTALFELLNHRSHEKDTTISVLLSITAFTAALTALCGFFLLFSGGYESSNDLYWHKIIGIITALFAGVLSWLREVRKIIYIPVLITGCIMLIVTGHLGSTITHGKDFITEPILSHSRKIKNLDEAIVYRDIIQSIFDEKCIGCHNSNKRKGSLLLSSYDDLLKGGENGTIITPGNADSSALYNLLLLPAGDDRHMPPEGKPQPDKEEIALVRWWISTGANPTQKFIDASVPDSISKIVHKKFDAGSALDQLNIAFADQKVLKSLDNNDRGVKQLSIEKPFISVFMSNRKQIDNKEFEELVPIKDQITSLDLSYSKLTFNQIKKIAEFPHLRALHLQNSNTNDSAINVVSSLKYLEYLNISNTKVTSNALAVAGKIKTLKKIFLYETDVPTAKINQFKKTRAGIVVGYTPDLSTDTSYRGRLTDPGVVIDSNMFLDYATVEMSYRLRGVDIHYTLDGKQPDSSSFVYKDPIRIPSSSTLKVSAMRSGWQSSKTLSYQLTKASHKFTQAKLETPPNKRYPAKLDSSLIDFKRGSSEAGDGKYIGYEGNNMTVLLDLGKKEVLNSLTLSYLVNHEALIFSPLQMEVWTTTADGKQLKQIGTASSNEKGFKKEVSQKLLSVKFSRQPVRYLKVKVFNRGKTPRWHPSKGAKTWIMMDEILAD